MNPPPPGGVLANVVEQEVSVTEAEWLTPGGPGPLLELVKGGATDRKLRLLAVACCRRIFHRMHDFRGQRAVYLAEAFADDPTDFGLRYKLGGARRDAAAVRSERGVGADDGLACAAASYAAEACVCDDGHVFWHVSNVVKLTLTPANRMSFAAASRLCRCVFGDPSRPVQFLPDWLTPNVIDIANGIYHGRRFDVMPVLADALEESGCDDPDVLSHCRSDAVHCRGCWVLDGLLEKG